MPYYRGGERLIVKPYNPIRLKLPQLDPEEDEYEYYFKEVKFSLIPSSEKPGYFLIDPPDAFRISPARYGVYEIGDGD